MHFEYKITNVDHNNRSKTICDLISEIFFILTRNVIKMYIFGVAEIINTTRTNVLIRTVGTNSFANKIILVCLKYTGETLSFLPLILTFLVAAVIMF